MPQLEEQLYCSQQINIPPKFPYMLKKFAKAAIKTQPYDLLRWSMEYFLALSEGRIPPVKTRLEYPIFNTEGGLSRGYLKVLMKQLEGDEELFISTVEKRWKGSCLDLEELRRILCLCQALYSDKVNTLHFFAVSAGMLTKSLTQTMFLICELLTNEPVGGSASISVKSFLKMYTFLAKIDASSNIKYINGIREGTDGTNKTISTKVVTISEEVIPDEAVVETVPVSMVTTEEECDEKTVLDEGHESCVKEGNNAKYHSLLGTVVVTKGGCLLDKLSHDFNIKLERSESVERIVNRAQFQHEVERHERYPNDPREIFKDFKNKQSFASSHSQDTDEQRRVGDERGSTTSGGKYTPSRISSIRPSTIASYDIQIIVFDEDNNEIPLVIDEIETVTTSQIEMEECEEEHDGQEEMSIRLTNKEQVALLKKNISERRAALIAEFEEIFADIAEIARFIEFVTYDLGVITGRQMSATSGEFVVNAIEREIWTNVEQQIALLPDPSTRKRKATPEQVRDVKQILDDYMREALEVIIPEQSEEEEIAEEEPDIVMVYAIPGIGPVVPVPIIEEFVTYVHETASRQAECIMPRNLRHFLCPPMEKYIEQCFDSPMKE